MAALQSLVKMQQLLVGPAELAAMLGLATRTIYNRLHTKGDLPPVMYLGRLPRFAISDVHDVVPVFPSPS